MLKFQTTLLFFAFIVSLSLSEAFTGEEVVKGNEYVDKLIEEMLSEHEGELDPYVMENSTVGFSKKVVFVNVTGEAILFNGVIKGLKSLKRVKNCALREEGDRLHVKAELSCDNLDLQYDGSVRFMNLGPTVQVFGKIDHIEVEMDFSVEATTGKNGTLHTFTVDDMKGMNVWISGLGPLNWAINPVLKGVTLIFKRLTRKLVENRLDHHIRERLPNYRFPVVSVTESPEETTIEITTEEETKKPEIVTEEETEEPEIVTEEETKEPEIVTEEETEEPEIVTEEETEEPEIVTEEETEEPEIVTEEETEEPEVVTEEETEEPEIVTEEETEEPEVVTEEETEEPEIVTEEETEEPEIVIEEETEEPEIVTEEETEEPEIVIEEDTEESEIVTEEPEVVIEEETEAPEEK